MPLGLGMLLAASGRVGWAAGHEAAGLLQWTRGWAASDGPRLPAHRAVGGEGEKGLTLGTAAGEPAGQCREGPWRWCRHAGRVTKDRGRALGLCVLAKGCSSWVGAREWAREGAGTEHGGAGEPGARGGLVRGLWEHK